jgi:hypothetical protein
VLRVRALRAVGVDGELHVPTLLGVLFEARQVQCVDLRRVEPSFRPSATVVVLADEDLVGEENHVLARRRLHLEGDLGEQVALVEP